jgi:endonuclease YncB( thermonuclease family)
VAAAPLLSALALLAASIATLPAAAMPVLLAQATDDGGRSIRQIAPEIVAPPTVDPDELEREAPRQPLSELGTAGPPKRRTSARSAVGGSATEPAKPQVYRPVAAAAGRIESDGLTIILAGIDILEPEQTCRGVNGDWPCGMVARTAFRYFLRGRALDCDLPDGELPQSLTATCRLGAQDLGAWLVANGWAKVSSTGPYAEEQAQAVEKRRGIFGPRPDPLPQAPVSANETTPVASDGAEAPVSGPPVAEPASPTIERQPLPEPKGLY